MGFRPRLKVDSQEKTVVDPTRLNAESHPLEAISPSEALEMGDRPTQETEEMDSLEEGTWADAVQAGLDPALLNDVEVATQRLGGRQTHIGAQIYVPCPADRVWQVLTAYDQLAEFIPNLEQSRCLPSPSPDTIRIEQIGSECFLAFKFCARVVLDMVEHYPHRLDFSMVEGDFKSFSGSWTIAPVGSESQSGTVSGVQLAYGVTLVPTRLMPVRLIEKHLRKNLVLNLAAIRQRAVERSI
jgi:ribosome-associated toxin RatA of RatAB toxin-antitoxin module